MTSPRFRPMRSTIRRGFRQACIRRFHGLLQLDRALDCVHRAGILDEDPIAHELDDAAAMFGDDRLQDFPTSALELSLGASLVMVHQAAVAGHISSQYSGKATLGAFFG